MDQKEERLDLDILFLQILGPLSISNEFSPLEEKNMKYITLLLKGFWPARIEPQFTLYC